MAAAWQQQRKNELLNRARHNYSAISIDDWRRWTQVTDHYTTQPSSDADPFMRQILESILSNPAEYRHQLNAVHNMSTSTLASPLATTMNETLAGDSSTLFDTWYAIFVVLFGVVLSILTAGGNLMVMMSFKMERQLQTISNYFLLSLAVADLTIGERSEVSQNFKSISDFSQFD